MIRVVKVNGLRTPEQRETVCYVGRPFAGWPATQWGNYGRLPCPDKFRAWLLSIATERLERMLVDLWEACDCGAKPLGCYCLEWDGTGETPGCHAAVWAELLMERYGR